MYAWIIDRYLMNKNKKQVYGTQFYAIGKIENGVYKRGKSILWPIEDEKNVNSRRKEIGINITIEEDIKRQGIEYIYTPEYEDMSVRKILKIEFK